MRAISLRPITPEPEPEPQTQKLPVGEFNDAVEHDDLYDLNWRKPIVIAPPQTLNYEQALRYAARVRREQVAGARERVVRYTSASGTFNL